jgi:hypothetical protein
MLQNFATGTLDGTGAAINISIGWIPDLVVVQNWEATDFARLEWYTGMAAASAIKTVTSTKTAITTLGISTYAGTTTAKKGFTIGADTDVNVSGESITWCAWRNAQ